MTNAVITSQVKQSLLNASPIIDQVCQLTSLHGDLTG
jgi:hypothetical protein